MMKLSGIKNKIISWYYQNIKGFDENDYKNNLIVKENNRTATILDGQDFMPASLEETSNKPLKIKSLDDYRIALKEGITEFDFSELNTIGEDIQNLDLENKNLKINLRRVFVPFGHSTKWGRNTLEPTFAYGDSFLHLNKANLKGNQVVGNLSYFQSYDKVYIWYNEDTFDETYKKKYPDYFLSENAPQELKEKYYNPQIITKEVYDFMGKRLVKYLIKQTLTFNEFIEYYEFLHGKYLGNFEIDKIEKYKIDIVEIYGLEKAKEIFIYLALIPIPLETILEMLADTNTEYLYDLLSDKNIEMNTNEVESILQAIENSTLKREITKNRQETNTIS